MSEAKFTGGEWRRHYSPNCQEYVICDRRRNGGYAVASLSGSNSKANAHLIAAAPEMYAMLKEARKLCHSGGYFDTRDKIDSALAKPRGEWHE